MPKSDVEHSKVTTNEIHSACEPLRLGLDVGSTTCKAVVLSPETGEVLHSRYLRHGAKQAQCVRELLVEIRELFPDSCFRAAICGSGARAISKLLNIPFIQEVVANSISVRTLYASARTAIELGGQDAKMVFFAKETTTQRMSVSDMRMNGSCAGGTGAFIDEIASLLKTPVEQYDELASKGAQVYDISGRCGVYAKTDIQPLLNQGVSKEDIALSAFHSIAKQTIGGLAQGLDIEAPVIFEGGPLTFNPTLIRVFAERLELGEDDIIVPEHPETLIALGAALSLDSMFRDEKALLDFESGLEALASYDGNTEDEEHEPVPPFFANEAEREAFNEKFALPAHEAYQPKPNETVRAYLGIDSGSTTTKFALLNTEGELIADFYASNAGEPLEVARTALIELRDKYRSAGASLEIIAAGTTGYGELLFHKAFSADYHVVETVAHAQAAQRYVPDVSFILDIGGQDMKAISLRNGIVTDIIVNEACSSGCGSFLENFATNLEIPTEQIAQRAFESSDPAALGSRCTVFMNSRIVAEQRNGKTPDDIMAGLCRSIIENVFTKVIRMSNFDALGDHVVVQGGTFMNDAVLRAFELYTQREVTRAPYPGLMGAIGVALLTKEHVEELGSSYKSTFIGLDALDSFGYSQQQNLRCPFCANHCNRTLMEFTNGESWITGNRCEKGEIVGDPKDSAVRDKLRDIASRADQVPNLYKLREKLLFQMYDCKQVDGDKDITIGMTRTLMFWEDMPFWTTFWRSLGFHVKLSRSSSRKMYEGALHAVTSDTVCFPAKLVHGHVRDLIAQGVDRIWMPTITTVSSENTEKTSESMCAVVKGYPMVIRNSDNPQSYSSVTYDNPLFHWYTAEDRERQLCSYMKSEHGIEPAAVKAAIAEADKAQGSFKQQLADEGKRAYDQVVAAGTYAMVLASRPYHNDALVNHDLPDMFTAMGIPVLTADAVPGVTQVDLSRSRLDIVNNYHARMLSSAVLAAQDPHLEYVQVVSFGCGHDAYLSDEIIRLMREVSGKVPLVLKMDESDIQGPLRIRVNSFVQTVEMRRKAIGNLEVHELQDPYPVKFDEKAKAQRTVLIPNTSHAFSRLMASAFAKQGVKTVSLDYGREEAIRLGKKYVHNDICFPAQIVIGECLAALESGKYDLENTAVATGKYIGDCRLTHYGALLRKALDDAGYEDIPIITNDDVDYHNLHPAFKMSLASAIRIAYGLPMIDALEELLRKIRPYELVPGSANAAFDKALDLTMNGLAEHGVRGMNAGFKKAIDVMREVEYDRSNPRPTVLIVGEYLLNFHPGSNRDIELYLENNGMEIIEARMTDVIRKTYFYKHAQVKEYGINWPLQQKSWWTISDNLFEIAHSNCDRIARKHPLYQPATRMGELVKASDPIIHHTFDAGEGVLIPGEILHHAARGCKAFVILQPFSCLPNHVVGRGITKRLKEMYPDVQILPLDYDPDVSTANVENRLQMLIMNAKDNRA